MSGLVCVGWQESARENLASKTTIQASKVFCLYFLNKIFVDEELKLSKGKFKQTIDDFFKDKNIVPLSQLTATTAFPKQYMLVHLHSKHTKTTKTRHWRSVWDTVSFTFMEIYNCYFATNFLHSASIGQYFIAHFLMVVYLPCCLDVYITSIPEISHLPLQTYWP